MNTNLQLLVLVWLIWQSVRDLAQLRFVLQGLVMGSCCAAILTIINSRGLGNVVDAIRYSGAGADPNELGLTMVLSLPMAYYVSATALTRFSRLLWLVPMPVCIVGVVLTVSRGGFLTTVVAMLGISIWHVASSSQMRFAPLIGGVLLLALGLAFTPKANLERIGTIGSEISSGRIGKRTQIWNAGLRVLQERPLTGVGAATFADAVEPYIGRDLAAHNVYVSVLTETGIIGFLIFSLVLITCFMTATHLGPAERFLWLIVTVIWCIGVMSLTWEYKKITWSVFGLLIATGALRERPAEYPLAWVLQGKIG
jgi:O-antigen ligase